MFVQKGERYKHTLAADAAAHTPVLVGDMVVFTSVDGKTGDEVECETVGVHDAVAGGAIAAGKNLTFASGKWTVWASGVVHGRSWSAAAANNDPFLVKLL